MKIFVLLIALITVSFPQTIQPKDGCSSELIKKAEKEGMRFIKIKDYPDFVIELWKCRMKTDHKKTFKKINQRTYESDVKQSGKLEGYTSSCAYCISAFVVLFYVYKITGN